MRLLAATTASHLANRSDMSATRILLVALLRARGRFAIEADPTCPASIARHAAILLGGAVVLAAVLIQGQSGLTGHLLRPAEALGEGAFDYGGVGPAHLSGDGDQFVPWALVAYAAMGAAWLAYLWLRPRRDAARQTTADRAAARRLVGLYGRRSLDYFTLRRDKNYYFSPTRDAVLAYRVVRGVVLVSGDPVGNPHAYDDLVDGFTSHIRRHGDTLPREPTRV